MMEYAELIKTEKSVTIFECWNKIEFLEWKIQFVHLCLSLLKDFYSESIAEKLSYWGFDFVQNLQEPDAYNRQLQLVENEAKTIIVLLNQKINEYNKLAPREEIEIEQTEMRFEMELMVMAKNGYKIDKNINTVFEYCAAVNAFLEENKLKQKTNGGRK